MADIWEAYQHLNKSLKLNLTDETLMKQEAAFKQEWLKKRGFPDVDVNDWEFFGHVEPSEALRTRKAR